MAEIGLGGQVAGVLADHGGVGRAADGQLGLGRGQRRLGGGQPGLGLGHVGAGDFTHLEAGLRLFELPFQDVDVLLRDAQGLLVATHADIGRHHVLQDGALDLAQLFAAREHVGLGGADPRAQRPARIEGLGDRQRGVGAARLGAHDLLAGDRVVLNQAFGVLVVVVGGDLRGRPQPGPGLDIVLVGRPQLGALGLQRRIGLIGQGDGVGERLRGGGRGGDEERGQGAGAANGGQQPGPATLAHKGLSPTTVNAYRKASAFHPIPRL